MNENQGPSWWNKMNFVQNDSSPRRKFLKTWITNIKKLNIIHVSVEICTIVFIHVLSTEEERRMDFYCGIISDLEIQQYHSSFDAHLCLFISSWLPESISLISSAGKNISFSRICSVILLMLIMFFFSFLETEFRSWTEIDWGQIVNF